jgi:hypothetical protein
MSEQEKKSLSESEVEIIRNAFTEAAIRLTNVIVDQVSAPRNDGSYKHHLYDIPFQLNGQPSKEWSKRFMDAWDNEMQQCPADKPESIKVIDDKIVLYGTRMEDVAYCHLRELKKAVHVANTTASIPAQKLTELLTNAKKRQIAWKTHIKNMADQLDFS